ncbi:pyridoxamine 5'-phosphate oxidase [Sphingobacterium sp. SGG-5]|uniref:pyridoxamine 5'-phosphate oxidase n=1 Tax=Sphingobacterium sp. SGG-5 TaxID=2710881 RepID=UPI0013EB98E4|nr:pyridoxamine 5'-phosphate oxidase [Sphingobacterium sp. SGG-5]NGM61996.1 pyridoxamine 5'-phosphate oxidase [Sphingobacterium sp. SGG-5]
MAIEHKDIAAIREDYSQGSLAENDVEDNPISQFTIWFEQAIQAKVTEPTAMVLSTISAIGFPSSRVVLLKDVKEDGFSFFTNFKSQKGQDLQLNNRASLLFFWPELQRQVRIEGFVERLSEEDSDEYFASRPRGSQIGAWASPQSQAIENRTHLEELVVQQERSFSDRPDVPRPPFWGGFFVRPVRFEFWQGRSSRLHDRIAYQKEDVQWKINRLAP